MIILFPADATDLYKVDSAFVREFRAAIAVGCKAGLVKADGSLVGYIKARKLGEVAIYRGNTLRPEEYSTLYNDAWRAGFRVINDPDQYRYAQELPQWYNDYGGSTFDACCFDTWDVREDGTIWGMDENGSFEPLTDVIVRRLGTGPYLVRDYVRSRRHAWSKACRIKDESCINDVVGSFIDLQGDDLYGGLAVLKYSPSFMQVGTHVRSGAPIFNEARYWILQGRAIACHTCWGPKEGGEKCVAPTDSDPDYQRIAGFKSSFYTMDLTQLHINSEADQNPWIVTNFGDGQVTALPKHVNAKKFYSEIVKAFP